MTTRWPVSAKGTELVQKLFVGEECGGSHEQENRRDLTKSFFKSWQLTSKLVLNRFLVFLGTEKIASSQKWKMPLTYPLSSVDATRFVRICPSSLLGQGVGKVGGPRLEKVVAVEQGLNNHHVVASE